MVSAALHATFRVIPLCGPDGSVGGCVEPSDIGLYPPPQLPNGGGAESPDPWGGGPGGILPLPNEGGGGSANGTLRGGTPLSGTGSGAGPAANGAAPLLRRNQYWVSLKPRSVVMPQSDYTVCFFRYDSGIQREMSRVVATLLTSRWVL